MTRLVSRHYGNRGGLSKCALARRALTRSSELGIPQRLRPVVRRCGLPSGHGAASWAHSERLVRRLILAGTGRRGGGGLTKMPLIVGGASSKAALTRSDPRRFLFFDRNPIGERAAADY